MRVTITECPSYVRQCHETRSVISFTPMHSSPARWAQALLHRGWGGDSEGLSPEQGFRARGCRARIQSPWRRFYFIAWLPLLYEAKSWGSCVHEICPTPDSLLGDPPAFSWSLSLAVTTSLPMAHAAYLWAGSRVNSSSQKMAEKNTLCKNDRFTQREDRQGYSSGNCLMVFFPNHN